MSFVKPVVLACSVALFGITACTEVHNEPVRERVVQDRGPDKVDVHVHDRDRGRSGPEVQNNIKVEPR
jgi:hypothetical protein